MKDEALFKQNLAVLCELFDKPLSQLRTSVYWKALEPFTDEQCERAFKELMLSSRFFPKPADFIEVLKGKQEDEAVRAWIAVINTVRRYGPYQSVSFDDKIIHAVIQFMGGWEETGNWKDSELTWKEKEFEKLYRIMSKNDDHPVYLPGLHEIENGSKGYEIKTDIVRIGNQGSERKQIEARV